MRGPDDDLTPEEVQAMSDDYFRWRWCPRCKYDSTTDEAMPPYSWVHDMATGEHRSRPR